MVPRTQTSLPKGTSCRCFCCLCRSCRCRGLSIAPWSSKLCGLQSMLGGVATQLAWLERRHSDRVVLTICASVTACRIICLSVYVCFSFDFSVFLSCTCSITIVTFSMVIMSGVFWFMVVFLDRRAVNSLSVTFPLCLPVPVRGYCMLHGWTRGRMSSLESFSLSVNITWVPLGNSFLFFFFIVWRVHRVMHDGGIFRGSFGEWLPWDVWCRFWRLKKRIV